MGEDDIEQQVAGNAPDDVKAFLSQTGMFFKHAQFNGPIFGEDIMKRMKVTEVSVLKKADEPMKTEGRVVCEIVVTEDMINGGGNVHGGCSAFLIDMCSTMALTALWLVEKGKMHRNVSQSLNIVYHSPADLGDKLRIVNTTLTDGARAQSARTEIWNATHHRLVSSGVHIKMRPSPPKAKL